MAGEWIALDCCLWEKLEVLRISKATGRSTNEVVGNLARLWAWSSHNVAEGRVECSLDDLEMVVGADTGFWKAVVDVGWLIIDGDHLEIPGWQKRFSQTAKSRILANQRQKRSRHAQALQGVTLERDQRKGEEKKGEENKKEEREEKVPSLPLDFWDDFLPAWNRTQRAMQQKAPPANVEADEPPDLYWSALERLPKCRFFKKSVTLAQFFKQGFARRILDGHFDGNDTGDGPPPLRAFEGDDDARFKATQARLRREQA